MGVLGYGEAGRAAVALLRSEGYRVCLSEQGTVTVDRGTVLAGLETGGHTVDFLRDCALVVASPGVRPDAEIRNALHLCGIPVMSELELAYQLLVRTADPTSDSTPRTAALTPVSVTPVSRHPPTIEPERSIRILILLYFQLLPG